MFMAVVKHIVPDVLKTIFLRVNFPKIVVGGAVDEIFSNLLKFLASFT